MYKVYLVLGTTNRYLLHSDDSSVYTISNAVANLDVNKASFFSFKIEKTHPQYYLLSFGAEVDIYQEDDAVEICLFAGRISSINTDIYLSKTVTVESFFATFEDTVYRSGTTEGTSYAKETLGSTVGDVMSALLNNHNSAVQVQQRIYKGVWENETTAFSTEVLVDTTSALLKKVYDAFGGYMYVYKNVINGLLYLDYRQNTFPTNGQIAQEGVSIISLDVRASQDNVYKYLLPLGKNGETIKTYNPLGTDYLPISGVYGNNNKTLVKTFNDVVTGEHQPYEAALYGAAYGYAMSMPANNRYISASVFDMHNIDVNIPPLKMLDNVRVVAPSQYIDDEFTVTKMQIDINNPEKSVVNFGKDLLLPISKVAQKGR